jgi:PAS domain S-box-containing protein
MTDSDTELLSKRSDALERVTDGIVALDNDFQYTFLNSQAETILGRSEDELLGNTVWDVFPETTGTVAEEELKTALTTQQERSFERYNSTLDRWFDVRVYPGEDGLTIYFTDVTEQKETEHDLKETNRQLTALIKNTSAAIYIKDTEGNYQLLNEAAAELFGLDPEEAIGKHDEELFDNESATAIREVDEQIIAQDEADSREAARYIDGEEYIFLDNKYPYHDEDGEVIGIMGISRDVTDRVEQEREIRRKKDRLDEFASVVSHDLRNPLNVAQGRTALLREICEEEEYLSHLNPIVDSLNRMESIIEDTLTLAREGETVGSMDTIQIIDLVGQCWNSVETAEAQLEIDDEFTIRGDRDRLRHVFENLFRNAVEHGGEDVTVRVGRTGDTGFYVEDDGQGISEDVGSDIFEAGHTSATGGTGFGLTIVRRIAEAHDWEVTITTGRYGGARFEFENVELVD